MDVVQKTRALLSDWREPKHKYSMNDVSIQQIDDEPPSIVLAANNQNNAAIGNRDVLLIDCEIPYYKSLGDAKGGVIEIVDNYLDHNIVLWK